MTLERGVIPPTLNQEFPDLACPLDTVGEGARRVSLRSALSNSFALGGQTACLVFLAVS
jgi:3-oxoacyl-[acyl-carrier-protein] synthase II